MTNPDGVRLLACPLCDSVATAKMYGRDMLFKVECNGCGCEVRGFDQCQQDAIDAWNTRAAPVPQRGVPVAWQKRPKFGVTREWTDCVGGTRNHDFWYVQDYEVRPLYAAPSRLDAPHSDPCPYCKREMHGAADCENCGCGSPGRATRFDAVTRSLPAATTGDTPSGSRSPASAAMGHCAGSEAALPAGEAVADQIIGQIEERFPNWRSFRDLIDCIDCTLHDLRALSPSSNGGEEDLVQRTASDASPPRSHPVNGD